VLTARRVPALTWKPARLAGHGTLALYGLYLKGYTTKLSLVLLKRPPGGGTVTSVFVLGHPPVFHAPHLARPPFPTRNP